jgi:hypothetical protein
MISMATTRTPISPPLTCIATSINSTPGPSDSPMAKSYRPRCVMAAVISGVSAYGGHNRFRPFAGTVPPIPRPSSGTTQKRTPPALRPTVDLDDLDEWVRVAGSDGVAHLCRTRTARPRARALLAGLVLLFRLCLGQMKPARGLGEPQVSVQLVHPPTLNR